MAEVIIVGTGPTGLMLAAELALAGVDVAVVDRRPDRTLAGTRALGLHARSIEVLDQRGIVDRFLEEGTTVQNVGFGTVHLDISDFPSRHPYGLSLWQVHTERLLANWVDELGMKVTYGTEVVGLTQDDSGVTVELADGGSLHAQYVVGCDGGRSVIRRAAGIEFPGWEPTMSSIIAEAEFTEEPPWGLHRDELGTHAFAKQDDGSKRMVVSERDVTADEPTLDDLRAALIAVWGTDYGVHSPTSISRFTDMARQAASYRAGRVLLAGDSAHVHSPVGGQGLNTGLQDAVNLGWKLAQVVHGVSPDSLLDTYHSERHPVAARVLQQCLASTALMRQDERIKALTGILGDVITLDQPRKSLGGMLSALDIHYDLGDGHPLLGRRMPDLDLTTADGPTHVYTLLHTAKPVLLNLGDPSSLDITPWADRVQLIDAAYAGAWELPVLGEVSPPTAVLIRPDGHVAWVGQGSDEGLHDDLTTWFGAA